MDCARERRPSTPATGDGLVFLAEPDSITALRQDTGELAWRLPFTGDTRGAARLGQRLAHRSRRRQATCSPSAPPTACSSGRRDLGVRVHAAPALAADRVYVPLEDGRVVALDVSTGAQQWARKLGGPPNDMLALDDRIYVGSDDNFLYCLLASNGEVAWRWRTGGDVIGVPVVDDAPRLLRVARQRAARARSAVRARSAGSVRCPGGRRAGRCAPATCCWSAGCRRGSRVFAMKDGTPAGEIAAPGELAAAPYMTDSLGLPQVVLVSRDVAKGTRVFAFRRQRRPADEHAAAGPSRPDHDREARHAGRVRDADRRTDTAARQPPPAPVPPGRRRPPARASVRDHRAVAVGAVNSGRRRLQRGMQVPAACRPSRTARRALRPRRHAGDTA